MSEEEISETEETEMIYLQNNNNCTQKQGQGKYSRVLNKRRSQISIAMGNFLEINKRRSQINIAMGFFWKFTVVKCVTNVEFTLFIHEKI